MLFGGTSFCSESQTTTSWIAQPGYTRLRNDTFRASINIREGGGHRLLNSPRDVFFWPTFQRYAVSLLHRYLQAGVNVDIF